DWKKCFLSASHHLANQLSVTDSCYLSSACASSIAQNGKAICNLSYFFQEMADIDYGDSFCAKFTDQCKQLNDIVTLQTAGRFIHQDDTSLCCQGARYLNYLLSGNRQISYFCIWTNICVMKCF